MDAREFEVRTRMKNDFPYYAPRVLQIKSQEGGMIQFELTAQQRKLHEVAERQLREKGRVRIIAAKGRKTKTSTYVQGRFYWKVTHRRGVKAFVIAHDKETTGELFDITDRFHRRAPAPMKPHASSSSVREMTFDELDSGYSVGTAGSLNVGRGFTPHYLHLSEASHFPAGEEIARGLMTAVADAKDTEIWIESTGNGPGDWFHSQVMAALAGKSDYEVVFLAWWLEAQYASDEPIEPTEEEKNLLEQCEGMTLRNIAWRRKRIELYGGGESGKTMCRREFPNTMQDVFASSDASFIEPELVEAAAKRPLMDAPDGSIVVGIDPGGAGDPTALVARRGGRQFYHKILTEKEPEAVLGRLIVLLKELKPRAIFVDTIGMGHFLVAALSVHFPGVRGVDFRRTAIEEKRYANKRAECCDGMKQWLKTASIQDNELLKIELCVFHYQYRADGALKIESKDDAKERGHSSPNLFDALAITFSEPVDDGIMDESLWLTWPHKARPGAPQDERLPACNFITAYAWIADEQWCVAIVGVFVPDAGEQKMAGQKTPMANAIVLKCMDGDGIYHFLDAATKLWTKFKPDYFYIPTRLSVVMKDLRVKNLMIRRAKFETVADAVGVARDVLNKRCAWVRNSALGQKLKARLARYPHGDDEAVYGCIGLALAHLRQRGNLAVQWGDADEKIPRRRSNVGRRTSY